MSSKHLTSFGLIVFTGLAAALSTSCFTGPEVASAQEAKKGLYYYGNIACKACHQLDTIDADGKTIASVAFTRGTEMTRWWNQDKHKYATRVLQWETEDTPLRAAQQLSKQIAANMKLDGNVWENKKCLVCHGVYVDKGDKVDEVTFGPEKRVENGVSCVVCHGPVGSWFSSHQLAGAWEEKTREEKTSDGLNDLWNPVTRAELCCKCHIGDASEAKVVTHDMYAAGHPPLPSIEIAFFGDAMPRHWENWREKLTRADEAVEAAKGDQRKVKEAIQRRSLYRRNYIFDKQPPETQQTEMAIVSAAVAFRTSMRLIAAQAADDQKSWPEYATFECYACHHELRKNSWRQKRVTGAPPGRPTMRSWSTGLLPIAVARISENNAASAERMKTLQEKLGALERAFTSRPFGDPQSIAAHARNLEEWADHLIGDMQQKPLSLENAKGLLTQVADLPKKSLYDFDTARQITWCFDSMVGELNEEVFRTTEGKSAKAELYKALQLALPKGQHPITPVYVAETLDKIADYDPAVFHEQMHILSRTLKTSKH